MNTQLRLELAQGGHADITLPEPGEFPSFYVCSMVFSGNAQFWQLLRRLMGAAGRPLCSFEELLRQQGIDQEKIAPSAMRRLLDRRGYGFGILHDMDPAWKDALSGLRKLLFLRDPRDLLLTAWRRLLQNGAATAASPFEAFLESSSAEMILRRYQRLAEAWLREPDITLLRYEHAISGWRPVAAEVLAVLKLPVDPYVAASIAATTETAGDGLPQPIHPSLRDSSSERRAMIRRVAASLEVRTAEACAVLGYSEREDPSYLAGFLPDGLAGQAAFRTTPGSQDTDKRRPRRGPGFLPDPVLFVRLNPNSAYEMQVLGRRVTMDVDSSGCRPVPGQPVIGEKAFAVYGCSFTYGLAVQAEETFCSLLQRMFPAWRIENHGVSAYSTVQNLIQLERNSRWSKPELVTFCWLQCHLERNVAELSWLQRLSGWTAAAPDENVRDRRLPRGGLDSGGALQLRSVRFPRRDLIGIDCSDFRPDRYYLDQVCCGVFERANRIVTAYGGHFFVTILKGKMSTDMTDRMAEAGIPFLNASLNGDEYLCLPDDPHPNVEAHRIYAERMRNYLRERTGQAASALV